MSDVVFQWRRPSSALSGWAWKTLSFLIDCLQIVSVTGTSCVRHTKPGSVMSPSFCMKGSKHIFLILSCWHIHIQKKSLTLVILGRIFKCSSQGQRRPESTSWQSNSPEVCCLQSVSLGQICLIPSVPHLLIKINVFPPPSLLRMGPFEWNVFKSQLLQVNSRWW